MKFSFSFDSLNKEVFFAFSYPFSYQENLNRLQKLDEMNLKDKDIYYHRELMIKSPQDRDIDLVTISSQEGKLNENEAQIEENLFPNQSQTPRARK